MGGKKRPNEGGGGGAGAGGGPSGWSKSKNSKKAKGKTFQVVPGAGAPAPRSGGGDSESEDDAEAIRRANAKAIAQREHQQRVSSEHKAKAALEKQQGATAKSAGAGKGAAKHPAPTAVGKSAKSAPKPAPSKGKASAPNAAGKGKQKREGAARPVSEDDESGESSDSDSDSDEEGIDMTRKARNDEDSGSDVDEINVTFDSLDPVEADFHGIKLFVAGLLDGEKFDSSELVDIVLEQSGRVGTVVKDEDDVYGVLSVIDMKTAPKRRSIKQIADYVVKKCPTELKHSFTAAVRGNTGLIINERMINMPPELAVPLLDGLLSEIETAQKDPHLKGSYSFENFLILTQLLRDGSAAEEEEGSRAGGKQKKKKTGGGPGEGGGGGGAIGAITWLKAEDECLSNHAHAAFEFALNKEPEEGFHFYGKAMLVQSSRMPAVRAQVLQLVGDEALRNQEI